MEFTLKVIGNQAAIQQKNEPGPNGTVVRKDVNTARVTLRGDDCTLQFATEYETGKKFELGREIKISVPE